MNEPLWVQRELDRITEADMRQEAKNLSGSENDERVVGKANEEQRRLYCLMRRYFELRNAEPLSMYKAQVLSSLLYISIAKEHSEPPDNTYNIRRDWTIARKESEDGEEEATKPRRRLPAKVDVMEGIKNEILPAVTFPNEGFLGTVRIGVPYES